MLFKFVCMPEYFHEEKHLKAKNEFLVKIRDRRIHSLITTA